MSLACPIGPEANILEPSELQCRRLYLEQPVLSPNDLRVICHSHLQYWKVRFKYSAELTAISAVNFGSFYYQQDVCCRHNGRRQGTTRLRRRIGSCLQASD